MDALIAWIQSAMREAAHLRLREPIDPDLIVMLGVYVGCAFWLVRLWRIRNRPDGRGQIARAVKLGDMIFTVLAAIAMLAFRILIALARAAGRSHYPRW